MYSKAASAYRGPDPLARGLATGQGRMTACCISQDWMPTLLQGLRNRHADALGRDGLSCPHYRANPKKRPTKRFWQFNRYDPHRHLQCRDERRRMENSTGPALKKPCKNSNRTIRHSKKNLEVPHFLMKVENPPVERTLSPPDTPELYNIENDPHENINLAQQQPNREHRMKRELETWFEAVEADRRRIAQ